MIVKTENLSREFVRGKNQFYAVDHVNLEVEEKEHRKIHYKQISKFNTKI